MVVSEPDILVCVIYTWVIVQIGQGKTNISIKIMYNILSIILSNTMYEVLIMQFVFENILELLTEK